jgi:NhaA family Na+:H+ antiporter
MHSPIRRVLTRLSRREQQVLADVLRTETVGGVLLLIGAAIGLIWANSQWSPTYHELLGTSFGPSSLHLDLTVQEWTADGILALFFFVAGLELKRELVSGDLRDPVRAAVPVVAAICGVILPAAVYLAVTAGTPGAAAGWAVPVATDIAVALAALAVMGTHLPTALRSFLLTLAVVDDLIAVLIIAVAYTDDLHLGPLLVAIIPLVAFGAMARWRAPWWLLPAPAVLVWALVHESGVHATIAGIALAFTVPAAVRHGDPDGHNTAERYEHAVRPISAGFAVPIFALFAAGVSLRADAVSSAMTEPIVLGVIAGLVIGKPLGVFGGTYLIARFTKAELDPDLSWADIAGVSLLSGIGFTVSLLIGELAFGSTGVTSEQVRLAVLIGTVLAALAAAVILLLRNRHYKEIEDEETPAAASPATAEPG